MVLIALIELYEIAAPAPDPDYEIPVLLRMLLGIEKSVPVDSVYLQLMASEVDVFLDKHCYLRDALIIAVCRFGERREQIAASNS